MKPAWLFVAGAVAGVALVVVGVLPAHTGVVQVEYVYSPDFADLVEPLITEFNNRSEEVDGRQIEVVGVSTSSGEARTDLVNGQSRPALWTPASSLWGELVLSHDDAVSRPSGSAVSLVTSPQVIAMRRDCAQALGWSERVQPSWQDVISLARDQGAHEPSCRGFTLAATYPDRSTSGLFAVASWYVMATGRAHLTTDMLRADRTAQREVAAIERLPVGYGETSVGVVEHMCRGTTPQVAAVYLQENTMVTNNNPSCLRKYDPGGMVAVYPSGGTYIADYPLYLVTGPDSTATSVAAAGRFRSWLVSAVTPQVAGAAGFRTADGAAAGLVDEEHGAIPVLPRAPDVLPDVTPPVASWLQAQWLVDCGAGSCVHTPLTEPS